MPEVSPELALEHGLFSRRQARAAGHAEAEIARRIRRGQWVTVCRGVLQVSDRSAQDGDTLLTAVLRAGPSAVASHLSAAAVLGWDLLKLPPKPQVTVPRDQSSAAAPGAALFRRTLSEDEIEQVGVLRLTCPARTALDIAADQPCLAAVVALDSALRLGQLSPEALHRELRRRRTMPRYRTVLTVFDHIDPSSASVWESVARCLFRDAGLPEPVCQYDVISDGTLVARVDFAWPAARLVVEIDGFAWHSTPDALSSDHARQNRLELAEWTVLRYSANDVRDDPGRLVTDVRAALAAFQLRSSTHLPTST